ncbi:MAG: inositol monophosphatase [Desulfobacca sp.]|nr:inositol monophosphatase [Desulfobacca sp.]
MNTTPFNLDQAYEWAMEAVLEAGRILKKGFRKNKPYQKKGAIDLVTEWDFKSQETVIAKLQSHFPQSDFLVEESGVGRRISPYCWILDPLDGTTNFVHGFPFFCISLALTYKNIPLLGIVHNPELKETYWALRGKGAFFNDRLIRVSSIPKVSQSLLATGFPYTIQKTHGPILKRFEQVIIQAQGLRRPGSAALDLCWVARGVLDGFWEQYLKPWDTAAGILIVEEAGGKVSDFSGRPYHFKKKQILATNGQIHHEMIPLLAVRKNSDRLEKK